MPPAAAGIRVFSAIIWAARASWSASMPTRSPPPAIPLASSACATWRQGSAREVAGYTGLPAEKFSGLTLDAIPDDQKGTFDRILVFRALHSPTRAGTADTEIRAMRELLKDDGV